MGLARPAVSRPDFWEGLYAHSRMAEPGPPAESVERRRGLEWLVLAERLGR
jgi:hypothetical protein